MLCRWRLYKLSDLACLQPDAAQLAETSVDSCLIQHINMQESHSGVLGAVLVGNPCLDAVVVVDRTAGLFCSAQKTCRHVKAAQGDNHTAAEWNELQQQSWEQQFEHRFDRVTGRRLVTSGSKVSAIQIAASYTPLPLQVCCTYRHTLLSLPAPHMLRQKPQLLLQEPQDLLACQLYAVQLLIVMLNAHVAAHGMTLVSLVPLGQECSRASFIACKITLLEHSPGRSCIVWIETF